MKRATLDPIRIYSIADMREIDRRATADFGVPSILLMEHAAQALTEVIVNASDAMKTQRVLIICGPGQNGGDGYAAARLLLNSGIAAHVVAVGSPRDSSDAAVNASMAAMYGVYIHPFLHPLVAPLFRQVDIVVDCVFGTGLTRAPEGESAEAIHAINEANDRGALVVSADVPSGLDADLGLPIGPSVRADYTVTFGGMKIGYVREEASKQYTGMVVARDIGLPKALLEKFGELVKRTPPDEPEATGKKKPSPTPPRTPRVTPRPRRRRRS